MLEQFMLPMDVAMQIAVRDKEKRKKKKMTQAALCKRAGMSLGSLKRFEQTGEISFVSLLKIADVLDEMEEFQNLFTNREYSSIQEVIDEAN